MHISVFLPSIGVWAVPHTEGGREGGREGGEGKDGRDGECCLQTPMSKNGIWQEY